MRHLGIRGASRSKKRFTTKSDPTAVRAPDLVNRNFSAARPDELWVADFTYCSTSSGIVYVAFIIDVFSRRLVGWKAARSMTTTLVLDALNMAAWTRRHTNLDGLTCHTDAGSQYTSILYTERLDDVGAPPQSAPSATATTMPSPNRSSGSSGPSCTRNPAALAQNGGPSKGLDDLEIATCAWVWWFNEERLHSELGVRKPNHRASVKPRPIQFSELWISQMETAIAAIARSLANECLDSGLPNKADRAVRRGLLAAPYDIALWRLRLRVASAIGPTELARAKADAMAALDPDLLSSLDDLSDT